MARLSLLLVPWEACSPPDVMEDFSASGYSYKAGVEGELRSSIEVLAQQFGQGDGGSRSCRRPLG